MRICVIVEGSPRSARDISVMTTSESQPKETFNQIGQKFMIYLLRINISHNSEPGGSNCSIVL